MKNDLLNKTLVKFLKIFAKANSSARFSLHFEATQLFVACIFLSVVLIDLVYRYYQSEAELICLASNSFGSLNSTTALRDLMLRNPQHQRLSSSSVPAFLGHHQITVLSSKCAEQNDIEQTQRLSNLFFVHTLIVYLQMLLWLHYSSRANTMLNFAINDERTQLCYMEQFYRETPLKKILTLIFPFYVFLLHIFIDQKIYRRRRKLRRAQSNNDPNAIALAMNEQNTCFRHDKDSDDDNDDQRDAENSHKCGRGDDDSDNAESTTTTSSSASSSLLDETTTANRDRARRSINQQNLKAATQQTGGTLPPLICSNSFARPIIQLELSPKHKLDCLAAHNIHATFSYAVAFLNQYGTVINVSVALVLCKLFLLNYFLGNKFLMYGIAAIQGGHSVTSITTAVQMFLQYLPRGLTAHTSNTATNGSSGGGGDHVDLFLKAMDGRINDSDSVTFDRQYVQHFILEANQEPFATLTTCTVTGGGTTNNNGPANSPLLCVNPISVTLNWFYLIVWYWFVLWLLFLIVRAIWFVFLTYRMEKQFLLLRTVYVKRHLHHRTVESHEKCALTKHWKQYATYVSFDMSPMSQSKNLTTTTTTETTAQVATNNTTTKPTGETTSPQYSDDSNRRQRTRQPSAMVPVSILRRKSTPAVMKKNVVFITTPTIINDVRDYYNVHQFADDYAAAAADTDANDEDGRRHHNNHSMMVDDDDDADDTKDRDPERGSSRKRVQLERQDSGMKKFVHNQKQLKRFTGPVVVQQQLDTAVPDSYHRYNNYFVEGQSSEESEPLTTTTATTAAIHSSGRQSRRPRELSLPPETAPRRHETEVFSYADDSDVTAVIVDDHHDAGGSRYQNIVRTDLVAVARDNSLLSVQEAPPGERKRQYKCIVQLAEPEDTDER